MTRPAAAPTADGGPTYTEAHWREQEALAIAHALARPAPDLKGFFEDLRDAADFNRRALAARSAK